MHLFEDLGWSIGSENVLRTGLAILIEVFKTGDTHATTDNFRAIIHITSAISVSSIRQAAGLSKTGRNFVAP